MIRNSDCAASDCAIRTNGADRETRSFEQTAKGLRELRDSTSDFRPLTLNIHSDAPGGVVSSSCRALDIHFGAGLHRAHRYLVTKPEIIEMMWLDTNRRGAPTSLMSRVEELPCIPCSG